MAKDKLGKDKSRREDVKILNRLLLARQELEIIEKAA